jgi:uracil-DNA glycosylase
LWIVAYREPDHPGEVLSGGALVVPEDGPVYQIGSLPNPPEMVGVLALDLPIDWADMLEDEVAKPYWEALQRFVASERAEYEIYPAPQDVFAAFELTPFEKVRVVILGQDPYFKPGQANGLCFSVPGDTTVPPSLRNIFMALSADGITPPPDGDLTGWARQGVLLLNTTLTVRRGAPNSHRGQGWEAFTDAVTARSATITTGWYSCSGGGPRNESNGLSTPLVTS